MPFMIRDRRTGKFQLGGANGSFSKQGKIWNTLGGLKGHLAIQHGTWDSVKQRYAEDLPPDWEVVEVELRPIRVAPAAHVKKQELCTNCNQPKKEHEKKSMKCLFAPGVYKLWEDVK